MSSSLLLLRQLQLLLRKNFILQIRRPIGTVFELLIPVLALALAVVIGYKRSPGRLPETNSSCFTTFQSNFLQVPQKYGTIYYAPDTTNATAIMQFAIQQWPQLNGSLIGVANGTELQKILLNLTNEYTPGVCDHAGIAGVYFDNVDTKDIQYTLRFPYEEDWASDQVTDMSSANTYSLYMMYGFINLQRIVEQSIIAFITQGQTTVDVDLSMRQFPYPPIGPRTNDEWYTNICIPLLLMLAFMYTFAQIVKELVIEKESRIRESMLMMGLRLWVLWTTWFIKQLLFMSIWVVAFSVILKFLSVWPESDVFLLLIFFLLYTTSTIAFGFLVSVWFNSPLVSLVVSFIVFFLSFLPNYFIYFCTNKIPYGGKLALGLLSNTAFGLGVNVISSREWNGVGLQWSNVADPLSTEEPLNMGAVFGMMICDIILYMLIAWYVDAVKPGRYGVPKPFYFPFLPSYWTGKPWKRFMGTVEESSGWHDPQAHEEQPRGLKAGINIQNLTKIYDQVLSDLL